MGYMLVARKVPRRGKNGRVTGRDALTPVGHAPSVSTLIKAGDSHPCRASLRSPAALQH